MVDHDFRIQLLNGRARYSIAANAVRLLSLEQELTVADAFEIIAVYLDPFIGGHLQDPNSDVDFNMKWPIFIRFYAAVVEGMEWFNGVDISWRR